ncbi:MAG: ATP-binding cassette domain-containing protein [Chlamydiales bacterium]|nr:ATP-binding cassette domain-containing protein [Chlamydiales bacterium]
MKNPLVQIKNLKKHYIVGKQTLKAVDDASLEIYPGETLGLVGESGCGKSTLGKTLVRLETPTSGEIYFEGEDISTLSKQGLKEFRKKIQMIFQDPYASLNPRMMAKEIIAEPLDIHGIYTRQERQKRVEELLDLVGLSGNYSGRFPHELSGGQRQRIGIARALAVNPSFLVCDEPISALDVSVQAQIITLLKRLQEEMGLTYLFIAHDLAMVKYLSTRVAVMYLGHLVELAPSDELYAKPLHPYTQALLSAIPIPDPKIERSRTRIVLTGEVPNASNPPAGCIFSTRCPHATEICHRVRPSWKESSPGHFTSCHLHP